MLECLKCPRCKQYLSSSSSSKLAPAVIPCGHYVCVECHAEIADKANKRWSCSVCPGLWQYDGTEVAVGMIDLLAELKETYPFLYNPSKGKTKKILPIDQFPGFQCTNCKVQLSTRTSSKDAPEWGACCGHPVCISCAQRLCQMTNGHNLFKCVFPLCRREIAHPIDANLNRGMIDFIKGIRMYVNEYIEEQSKDNACEKCKKQCALSEDEQQKNCNDCNPVTVTICLDCYNEKHQKHEAEVSKQCEKLVKEVQRTLSQWSGRLGHGFCDIIQEMLLLRKDLRKVCVDSKGDAERSSSNLQLVNKQKRILEEEFNKCAAAIIHLQQAISDSQQKVREEYIR